MKEESSRIRQGFPQLWLHPYHTRNSFADLISLPVSSIKDELESISCSTATQQQALYVVLNRHGSLIGRHDTGVLHISLHLASISLMKTLVPCGDGQKLMPSILVKTSTKDADVPSIAWAILVESDMDVAHSVLMTFGRFGGIRSDLLQSFKISDTRIGVGGHAKVVCVSRKKQSQRARDECYALKCLNSCSYETMAKEAFFLSLLGNHPHICTFFGVFCEGHDSTTTQWSFLLEYCSHGDLHSLLMGMGPLCQGGAAETMIGVLSAVSHIHSQGIVHRDVKAENVLLMEDGRVVLTDFGIAAFLEDADAMSMVCGSPCYAAPEVLQKIPYDDKIDVFSSGVLLYFTLSKKLPFTGPNLVTVLRRVVRCDLSRLFQTEPWQNVSEQLVAIITAMLQKSANDRPAASQALGALENFYTRFMNEQVAQSQYRYHAFAPAETSLSSTEQ